MYVPWFGELPFYAATFLKCCSNAPQVQWVVHSDQEAPVDYENVTWVMEKNLSERIANTFSEISVPVRNWGHKLCDLKPFWHEIFKVKSLEETKFRGWADWDLVHDLSGIEWDFESAKFTNGWLMAPLYIQKNIDLLNVYPTYFEQLLKEEKTVSWSEAFYLPLIKSEILQSGMTPGIDIREKPKYVCHMHAEKLNKKEYENSIKLFCDNLINVGL